MAKITRRGFFVFGPAAVLAVRDMFAQQPRQTPAQIPAADPDFQDELEAAVEVTHKNTAEAGPELYAVADKLFDRVLAVLPEAQILPPKPKLYLYDGDQISVANLLLVEKDKRVSALAISRKAQDECSKSELTYAMAHEIAHMLINLNKGIADAYRLPDTHAVHKDLKELGITDENSTGYKRYKNEMLADHIAILLTRDPEALVSMLSKSGPSHLAANAVKADSETEKAVAVLESQGHHVSARKKRRMVSHHRTDYNKANRKSDPHPMEEIRFKAAREYEQELRRRERGAAPAPASRPGLN